MILLTGIKYKCAGFVLALTLEGAKTKNTQSLHSRSFKAEWDNDTKKLK